MRMMTAAVAMGALMALAAPAHAEEGKWQVKLLGTAVLPDGKITDVRFVQLTAYDRRSQMINQQAGQILLQETLDAQSANISGVSGATYTSESYIASLQSALDQM